MQGRRKSRTCSSPSLITGFTTTRETRNSSRSGLSDGGVIAIDSSSDEEEDTSIDTSNATPNNSNEASEVSF